MTLKKVLIPVGALAMLLSANVFPAAAQDRGRDRGDDNNRSGRSRRSDGQSRSEARAQRSDNPQRRDEVRGPRNEVRGPRNDGGPRRDDARARPRYDRDRRDDRVWRTERPNGGIYRAPRYIAPRYVLPRRSPYRHYGPGPGLGVYFGTGYGYRYGSPYSGRVYGYLPPRAYGVRRYYGDVRLEVRPREAAVYVDGYYAGIVDDFDGVFQRLTLEAGPHRIEIELPGFETRGFDVMVDPTRTVDVREDLFPERP
jgi:hypothetical protein